jgi:hypothetical protein
MGTAQSGRCSAESVNEMQVVLYLRMGGVKESNS